MHTLEPTIFACPPATWRGAYFWSINDRVDERRIREQVRHMHRQGQGGAFYHPRAGMTDAYLSRRFFEGVDAALSESRSQGMLFYLYDEDRFPSGFAGGYVMEADERHAALQLVRTVPEGGGVASYDVVPVAATTRFANRPFPSLLSEEAVAEFIRVTYDAYAARYGRLFGGEIPAIFTDEPNVRTDRRVVALPWAADFADVFRERKGYDIADELDALFEGGGEAQRVRYDYWEVIASLFEKRFTAQIARWCDEHGIMFTGHFWEHSFPNPTFTGSVMPNYARMQAPGIDMLFHPDWTAGRAEVQFGNNLIARELVSVGNQLGKRRLLSETHGAGGWDYEFSAMKRMLDWQFAHGINLVCQHLYHYSLRGYRKRDFPQSFGAHQPWSESYRLLGDYIGRLSYAVSAGTQRSDVLVLHPAGSTWTEWDPLAPDPAAEPVIESINAGIAGVLATLSSNQIAHDLGDEHLLERHGSVGPGPTLVVGRMAYRVVVLPAMTTIRTETLQLLSEFVTAGGLVLGAGRAPELLDGRPAPRLAGQLDLGDPVSGEGLVAALIEAGVEHLRVHSVSGPRESLFYQRRETDSEEILFLANVDRSQSVSVALDECSEATQFIRELARWHRHTLLAKCLVFSPVEICHEEGRFGRPPDRAFGHQVEARTPNLEVGVAVALIRRHARRLHKHLLVRGNVGKRAQSAQRAFMFAMRSSSDWFDIRARIRSMSNGNPSGEGRSTWVMTHSVSRRRRSVSTSRVSSNCCSSTSRRDWCSSRLSGSYFAKTS